MPTRYIVHGTDQVTGQTSRKVIEAETAADAEAIAARIGLAVTGSEIDADGLAGGVGAGVGAATSGVRAGPRSAASVSVPGPVIDQSAELEEWRGTPSLWNNFWWYVSCILVITIPVAIFYHLKIKFTKYILTNQRLRIETGIISRDIEEIELYRIQDTAVEQNMLDRSLGIGIITIVSSDERSPSLTLPKIARPRELREKIRVLSEARRRWRKVTEIELQQ